MRGQIKTVFCKNIERSEKHPAPSSGFCICVSIRLRGIAVPYVKVIYRVSL